MLKDRKYKGFSLIEILIVVGLILILAAVTIVAINPAKHFRDTRNSERSAHISEILNAVTQYTAEEGRTLAELDIPACNETTGAGVPVQDLLDGNIDTGMDQLVPRYIVEIPEDPRAGVGGHPGYTICSTEGSRVEIVATVETETGTDTIDVTR